MHLKDEACKSFQIWTVSYASHAAMRYLPKPLPHAYMTYYHATETMVTQHGKILIKPMVFR